MGQQKREMRSCSIATAVATFAFSGHAVLLHSNASSQFMLVAGVSSAEENCLVETAGFVGLDACSKAVAAGDGREIWSLTGSGQLMNGGSKQCAIAEGLSLAASECSGATSAWKLLPNGQVQVGDKCLSQSGEGAGTENVAVHAAAEATSSADAASHAAAAAVDSDDATFWASRFGEVGPVSLTIDLGEARRVDLLKVDWQFPASSYAVAVFSENQWTEVFAMSGNVVKASRIPLGLTVSKVRLDMKEPSPSIGDVSDHPAYGINSVVLLSPRLQASLGDCADVSQSKDARDKYFAVPVSEFDPAVSTALQAEIPALFAATASLRAALSEVVALPRCNAGASMLTTARESATLSRDAVLKSSSSGSFDEADVKTLLATAKSTILNARDDALH